MKSVFLFLGALSALIGVGMGAFGAHALKASLSPEQLSIYQTGVSYQMWHALGLIGIALALLVLVATALSWVRAGRKRAESKAFSAAEVAAGPSPSAASQAQSLAARKRVRAELEDDEVQW